MKAESTVVRFIKLRCAVGGSRWGGAEILLWRREPQYDDAFNFIYARRINGSKHSTALRRRALGVSAARPTAPWASIDGARAAVGRAAQSALRREGGRIERSASSLSAENGSREKNNYC